MKPKSVLSAFVAVLAVGGLAACSSSSVNTSADSSTATSSNGATSTSAHVGDPVTIKGNVEGSQVQVTVKKVKETTSKDRFMKVAKKKKLVVVQFEIMNTGTVAYNDAPSNGAVVADSDGHQFEATIMYGKVAAGALLPTSVKLAPGNKALGYIAFEVPKRSTIAQVQFAMDSGFGETAQWEVP